MDLEKKVPHPSVKWSVSAISLIASVLLQTAAPAVWAQAAAGPVRAIPVAQGLESPWALAFLPEGRFLVTERPGRLRVVEADGRLNPPLAGLPAVAAGGQGGLLDVVLDRGFASNRTLYFCFSEPAPAGATVCTSTTAINGIAETDHLTPGYGTFFSKSSDCRAPGPRSRAQPAARA